MSDFGDLSVVVLAGGRGTRLQGLFPDLPKPMIPVAGKPFLHWLTRWIAKHGPTHFVYSTGYLADVVDQWVSDDSMPDIQRESRREDVPLGTGGGLLNCIDLCRDWILVVNGDSIVIRGVDRLLNLTGGTVDGGLLGVQVSDTSRYGRLETSGGSRLTSFKEKVPGVGLVNGGLYLFRKEALADFRKGPQSMEYDVLPLLLSRGLNLSVFDAGCSPFIDIGTPESISRARQFIEEFLRAETE